MLHFSDLSIFYRNCNVNLLLFLQVEVLTPTFARWGRETGTTPWFLRVVYYGVVTGSLWVSVGQILNQLYPRPCTPSHDLMARPRTPVSRPRPMSLCPLPRGCIVPCTAYLIPGLARYRISRNQFCRATRYGLRIHVRFSPRASTFRTTTLQGLRAL